MVRFRYLFCDFITGFLFVTIIISPVTSYSQPTCLQGSWQQVATDPVYPPLNSVSGIIHPNVYAVGNKGTILRFDGTEWTQMTSNTTTHLKGVWVESANDVWAVGGNEANEPLV